MTTCRSCAAPIMWAESEKSGKKIPIDSDPVPDGNITLHAAGGRVFAHVLCKGEAADPSAKRFKSHFATCPHSQQHRKR